MHKILKKTKTLLFQCKISIKRHLHLKDIRLISTDPDFKQNTYLISNLSMYGRLAQFYFPNTCPLIFPTKEHLKRS